MLFAESSDVADEQDADAVLSLLGDEYVREILAAASREPHSASDLSEVCDASLSTVYRRVDDLLEHGLLVESTRIDADGTHVSVYETAVEGFHVGLADGELRIDLDLLDDPAQRFAQIWEGIKNS
ncbi:helix-turn-helix domain-containing protein [Haloarchaeobius sp. HME9146]|uniref:ArsR/SmtB family transcription factor n=1 Tax=Haloarchaeobius sp. HME9146 TaxID=2978732 RepID=UPI0021BFC6DB|nr:helix-turn-helix domain-containing protein [Haloarchaeobius sp. HME9146]